MLYCIHILCGISIISSDMVSYSGTNVFIIFAKSNKKGFFLKNQCNKYQNPL